jgi:hypothetical protein
LKPAWSLRYIIYAFCKGWTFENKSNFFVPNLGIHHLAFGWHLSVQNITQKLCLNILINKVDFQNLRGPLTTYSPLFICKSMPFNVNDFISKNKISFDIADERLPWWYDWPWRCAGSY